MKNKLVEESKVAIQKARGDKNIIQQIKLICNIISPNNFEKKFLELRQHTFGNLKLRYEEGYNPEKDTLKD